MNDCLRTNVFVRFNPETIACACIYLAARQLSLPLPNNPHWFMALRISEEDVRTVCLELLSNYARPRPNVEKLEKMLRAAKERLQDAKKQARLAGVMLIDGTPQTNSLHGSPRVESPSTLKTRRREDRSPDAPRPSNNAHDSSPSPIRRSIHNSPAADRNGARSDPSSRQRKRTPPRGYRDDSISPVPEKRSKGDRHDRHEKKRHRDYRHRRSVSYSPARERRRSRSPRESRRRKKDKISNGSRSRDKYSDKYRR